MKFYVDTFFDKKKKFKVIFVLFSNFEAKSLKNGAKNQKTYKVNVLKFCTHQRVCVLNFLLKKGKLVLPYWAWLLLYPLQVGKAE
jgi:hypothetical protein